MAQIIPEDSLTNSHPGPQLHYCLQQLDDAIISRQHHSTENDNIGLRYWVKRGKQSLLLATFPEQSISTDMSLDKPLLTKHPLVVELITQRNDLLPPSLQHHAHQLLPIVLLLQENLQAKQTIHLKEQGLLAIGGVLVNGAMPLVFERCFGISASEQVNRYIHAKFSPELLVGTLPEQAHPQQSKLLDLQQETCLKKDLVTKTHPTSSSPTLSMLLQESLAVVRVKY